MLHLPQLVGLALGFTPKEMEMQRHLVSTSPVEAKARRIRTNPEEGQSVTLGLVASSCRKSTKGVGPAIGGPTPSLVRVDGPMLHSRTGHSETKRGSSFTHQETLKTWSHQAKSLA